MRKNYIFLLSMLVCFFCMQSLKAQQDNLIAHKGEKGIYIYNFFKPASSKYPDHDIIGFTLERKALHSQRWELIKRFETPADFEAFSRNVTLNQTNVFEKTDPAATLPEIWDRFELTHGYDSIGFDLSYQSIALGFNLLLVDTDIEPNVSYQYKITQVKQDKTEDLSYTTNVVDYNYQFSAIRPVLISKKEMHGVNKLQFYTIGREESLQGLMIKRKSEGEKEFSTIKPFYIAESRGDSVYYDVTDVDVQSGQLYQYTIAPVNKFGGGAFVFSDTIDMINYDQKMIIPKGITIDIDSLNHKNLIQWGYFRSDMISLSTIYRSIEYASEYEVVGTTSETYFVDESIVPGVKYYYYIEATDYFGRISEPSVRVYGLSQNEVKPEAPYWVDVVREDNKDKILWQDNQMDIRGYWVYRNEKGSWNKISDFIYAESLEKGVGVFVDTTSVFSSNAVQYVMTSQNTSNVESDYSKVITIQKRVFKPDAPVFVDLLQDKSGNRLFWRISDHMLVAGFNVYRKIGIEEFKKVNRNLISNQADSYLDSIHVGSEPIIYKLTAQNINNMEGDFSNEKVLFPNTNIHPPQNLKTFFDGEQKLVHLQWQPSQSMVSRYIVYRFVRDEDATIIGELDGKSTTFIDKNIASNKLYYYFVLAVDALGNISSPSNQSYEAVE